MQFIVHEDPVGRAASNYIARVDLVPFGMDGQVEQLWFKTAEDGSHEVACIPFTAYGLALGDTVLLDEDDYVREVVRCSGHRTLRLLFAPAVPPIDVEKAAGAIRAQIGAAGLLAEWNGARFVAVDIPPGIEPSRLFAVMEEAVNAGQAFWEWADAAPFVTSS